jgi:predicted TIM-barrel fold metal-dependent hydrolase
MSRKEHRMYAGDIVDPHHHLWDLSTGCYPWLTTDRPKEMVFGDPEPLAHDYLPANYRDHMAGVNIVKTVHIQATNNADDPTAETRWLEALNKEHGMPNGIVASAPLDQPEAEEVLAAQSAHEMVHGIRSIVSWHSNPVFNFNDRDDLMRDSAWRAGYALLEKYSLSFDLMLFPSQLGDALDLANSFPNIQIILNHTGSPADRDPAGMAHWRAGMQALAAAPNVAVKISDLCAYDHDWSLDSYRPVILDTIEWFGVSRCMFASDLPVIALHGGASKNYDAFKKIVSGFNPDEQRALFHDNAEKNYRLG